MYHRINTAKGTKMNANEQGYGWWKFGGSNLQAQYGYGSADEAERYCARLNSKREINRYAAEYLGDGRQLDTAHESDGFSLDEELAE